MWERSSRDAGLSIAVASYYLRDLKSALLNTALQRNMNVVVSLSAVPNGGIVVNLNALTASAYNAGPAAAQSLLLSGTEPTGYGSGRLRDMETFGLLVASV